MNGRTIALLMVALLIAGVTVVIVKNHTQSSMQSSLKVLVASEDIGPGSFVHADKQLAWADSPSTTVSPSFITNETHKIEDYNGAVARRTILSGEPITTLSLVRASEGGFMSAVLTPGERAVSIAVNPTSGNAGFIFPGDRVDLILTHRIPYKESARDVLASETFIDDVRVLAIDQMLDNPDNKAVMAKTITLEVSPKQAEMINVATNLGSISVSLRSLAGSGKPADKDTHTAADTKSLTVFPSGAAAILSGQNGSTYTTDNDVSKLMGDKNAVHNKISVYHGNTSEQVDFHQGQK